jgi:hypothetical protein|tara:strand:- start:341 stop:583 length:243 start_codon:yes stop_codon:yes gene_type:complete
MSEEQQYYVEVFDTSFNPLRQVGPVTHSQGLDIHRECKEKGLLSCITEKELVDLIKKGKRKTQEDNAKRSQAVYDYYTNK